MFAPDMFISGLGVYVPQTVSVQWAVRAGLYPAEEAELHELEGAAVAGEVPAPEMALRAAQDAVKRWGQPPEDIDLLLYADTWHQGPDGWPPHSYLQRHLVGGDVMAVEVRQGCNGMFSAMALAASYLQSGRGRTALLVAADNYGTPLMDRWRMGAGYIAGDAASAVVLSREGGFARVAALRSSTVAEAEELHRGGEPLFPPSVTTGRPISFGSRNAEYRSNAIGRPTGTAALLKIQQQVMEVVGGTLDDAGVSAAEVAKVAFMNYSREIVEQRCMSAFGLPMSRSTWDYGRTIGHCGASDQIIALDHELAAGQLQPGDHMLMLGTGPGVNISAAAVEILSLPEWYG